MTVMVTGASGVLGHAVVAALLARDEVRATVRRPAEAERLRAVGAKVAVLDPRHADDLAEVLSRCHTVVHLIGGVRQPDPEELFWANHGSVELALDAARQAGTTRFMLVSVPAADPEATHPFLRAKGMAEAAVTTAGIEHAIVRSTHIYGLGGSWFTATVQGATTTPPFVCGPGTQALAPVFAADVAAVIAAIDDQAGPLEGTWGIEGPDAVSADELVSILRADDAPPTHADGQAAAAALTKLLETTVDAVTASFFAMPSRADRPDAAAAFGVRTTPLLEGLRATLAAAGAHDDGRDGG
jgi:NADH dehydrogenase